MRPIASTDVRAALDSLLPMVIGRSELEGSALLLGGERWTTADGSVLDEQSPSVADEVFDLTGETITSVSWSSPTEHGLDPTLQLRSGGRLEVVSDAAFDTWQISLPDVVLVGPLVERRT